MPFHQDVHETMMVDLVLGPISGRYRVDDLIEPVCDRACDDREAIEQSGYDCDCTPIDTLMGDPGLGFNVAWAMEHGDEPADT
jgi:hypothetical protein